MYIPIIQGLFSAESYFWIMAKPSRVVYIHLLIWILFILLPILFIRAGNIISGDEVTPFYIGHTIRSFFMMGLFYLNYIFLIPAFFLEKKRLLFVFLNLLALIVVFFIMGMLEKMQVLTLPLPPPEGSRRPFLNHFLLTLIIDIVMAIGISLFQRLRLAERKKVEVELTYMKSRLNPHFLFNTLNAVYALAVKKSDDAPDAISRLSSIMRYLITESNENKVLLEKEVTYIGDFIELQKLRLTVKTSVDYTCEGITAGKEIVPMLLISFVENAFKYGVSTEVEAVIRIFIKIKGDELSLEVENDKVNASNLKERGNGLGLESARQLLKHFYQHRHSLVIKEDQQKFKVILIIQLV
ncbi:MAG: sensor histidine kinase [Bacteroidia bacterium]